MAYRNLQVPRFAWDLGGESWDFRANARTFFEIEKAYNFTLPFTELVNLNTLLSDRYRLLWAMSGTYRATQNPVIQTFDQFLDALPVGEDFKVMVAAANRALVEVFDTEEPEREDEEEEEPESDAEGN